LKNANKRLINQVKTALTQWPILLSPLKSFASPSTTKNDSKNQSVDLKDGWLAFLALLSLCGFYIASRKTLFHEGYSWIITISACSVPAVVQLFGQSVVPQLNAPVLGEFIGAMLSPISLGLVIAGIAKLFQANQQYLPLFQRTTIVVALLMAIPIHVGLSV